MNVVLYFTKEIEVLNFLEINKKCESVVESMKINPFLEDLSFERIKQLFIGLETYQLFQTPLSVKESFENISIIEYNIKDKFDFYGHRYSEIQSHFHKIRKLHALRIDDQFCKIAKKFRILRSLIIDLPMPFDRKQTIKPLFFLNDVVTLKNLTIHFNHEIDVNEFIELRKILRNVQITIVFKLLDLELSSVSKEYVDSISKLQGINVFFSFFDQNIIGKNIAPVGLFQSTINTLMNDPNKFYDTLSISYPTQLKLLIGDEEVNIKENEKDTNVIDFSNCSMLMDLEISTPYNSSLQLNFPTTLTSLFIQNNNEIGLSYESLHNIPLICLDITNETGKNLILPTTLTELSIAYCINCSFSYPDQSDLRYLYVMSCENCIIPISDKMNSFYCDCINKNKYIKYGGESRIEHFFTSGLYEDLTFNCRYIRIVMNKNAFIDTLDISQFEAINILLEQTQTNKLLCGNKNNVMIDDSSIKEIVFGTISRLECKNRTSIENIIGDSIEVLTLGSSTNQPNIAIKNYVNKIFQVPQGEFDIVTFNQINENIVDLTTLQTKQLVIRNSSINTLVLPACISKFENNKSTIHSIKGIEKTKITEKQKIKMIQKYSNGVLPPLTRNKYCVGNVDWEILDARNVKVNDLTITNCRKLTQILVPNLIRTLCISNCSTLETVDLTGIQLNVASISNCESLKTLLVNDNVKKVINHCPLLN
ncbi:LRR containing protein [Entamoeba marina]